MKIVVCSVAACVFTSFAAASERPTAPVDAQGNRAVETLRERAFNPTLPSTRFDPSWTGFGPGGATVSSVAASLTVAGLRLAGVANSFGGGGLYRSTNNGDFWEVVNDTGARAINEINFATDGSAYAATQDGLFKSTDGGATWTELVLPQDPALVESVSTDPTNAQVVWIGLGQFLGGTNTELILRSTDGGATWNNVSPAFGEGLGVTTVNVDPGNASRVFAAFSGAFGAGNEIWVTTDGGTTWNERSENLPNNIIWSFAFSGNDVYVGGGQDFGSQFVGLHKTSNNGETWTELSTLDWPNRSVTAVAVDPTNSQRIFAGTQRAGLGISTDGGATWTFSAGGSGEYPVNDIAFVPGQASNIFLGMGSIALLRSTNSGGSFTVSAGGINRVNLSSIAVSPTNPNEISVSYVGDNDGGIYTSMDGGTTWTLDTNAPLPRWQVLVYGPNGTLYGTHDGPLGRADDGCWVRGTNGTWSNLGPGTVGTLDTQGKAIAISEGPNPKILFAGQEGFFAGFDAVIHTYNRLGTGQWEKSYEAGAIQSEEVSSVKWLDGGNGPTAVASIVNFGFENGGAGGILRSTNNGQSWARSETGWPAGWHAWMLSGRPSEPNTIYTTGSEFTFSNLNNRVFKSTDGGVTWNDQSTGDTMPYRDFIVDPELPSTMYAANLNNGQVEISENDGGSFSSFSAGLIGQGGGTSFAYDAARRRLLYGTTAGAFQTPLEPVGCPADLDNDGDVANGGVRDGAVEINDLLYFVQVFEAGTIDLDNDGADPQQPDGGTDVNDLLFFLLHFEGGC